MFTKLKAAALCAAAMIAFATSASAAPISYKASDVKASVSNNSDSYINVTVDGINQSNATKTVDTGQPDILRAIRFNPRANPSRRDDEEERDRRDRDRRDRDGRENNRADTTPDSFSVFASIVLRVGTTAYTFAAEGLMTNWTVGSNGQYLSGALSWIKQPVTPPGSPLSVVFNSVLIPIGEGQFRTTLTVSAAPSVVPLPGGVVLLLTAMAGLFGLSRRRRTVSA